MVFVGGGMVLLNLEPKRMSTIIRDKPPGPGDVYESPQRIPLYDEAGNATGFFLVAGRHEPSPSPDLPDLVPVPDENGFTPEKNDFKHLPGFVLRGLKELYLSFDAT